MTEDTIGASSAFELAGAAVALLCLVAAAVEDGWRYRISNALVGGVVIGFVIFAIAHGSWSFAAWSMAAAVAALAVSAVLFAFGVFGGGDAKLIAAMALWTQFAALPRFAIVMSLWGGALGVLWLARRRLRSGGNREKLRSSPAPAGAAGDAADALGDPEPRTIADPPIPASAAHADGAAFARLPYGIAIALAGIDFFLFWPASPLAPWLPF